MSTDLGRALRDLTADVAGTVRPVDVDHARSRVRRRRTRGVVLRCSGAVVAVGALVTAGSLMGVRFAVDLEPVPVPPSSPRPSSGDDPTSCGATFSLPAADDPEIALIGAVEVGTYDPEALSFEGTSLGDTLRVDVSATSGVPAGPFDGGDQDAVTAVLVDPDGTVAFRTDPALQIRGESADGSGTAPDGLYDAVDCRTGDPLTGTYRAFATTATTGESAHEVVELGTVVLGSGGGQWAGQWPSLVPTCGEPAPADLLAGTLDADLAVTLDPDTDLDDLRGGLHADVTLTATADRLVGRVPQAVHAVLVDAGGTVVSRLYDPTRGEYDSGATFDVAPGESFPAEVYQWFASCPDADRSGDVPGGTYDLYVYSVILAAPDPTSSPSPRIAVGGPYPVSLR